MCSITAIQYITIFSFNTCSVRDVMTSDPICVRPETSIADAANLLLRKRIRRLPVVDGQGKLLGIITRSNIIKAAWEARKN